ARHAGGCLRLRDRGDSMGVSNRHTANVAPASDACLAGLRGRGVRALATGAVGRLLRHTLGAISAGLAITMFAACTRAAAQTRATPTTTSSLSIYISEGALSSVDGSSRWSADLGRFPPVSAAGVLYARVISSDRKSELVRAVRALDGKE